MFFILMDIVADLLALFHGSYASIAGFIGAYSYVAIFLLMILESASLPIPSEMVLPAIGYFAAQGDINVVVALLVALAGSIIGMGIDYYLAYFFEKEVIYTHLQFFHIKKAQLERFDAWFYRNGPITVFISRMLPVVRGFINFPAGFAMMPIDKFYMYSIAGVVIWEVVLVGFGYYALMTNIYVTSFAAAAFALAMYLLYRYVRTRI